MPLHGIPRTTVSPESAPFAPAGPRDGRLGSAPDIPAGGLDGRPSAVTGRPARPDRALPGRPGLLERTPGLAHLAPPAVPDLAPSYTDPELWGLLTSEERVFFRKPGADPALTYNRTTTRKRPEPPKIIGARFDVRV